VNDLTARATTRSDLIDAHVSGFATAFYVSSGLGVLARPVFGRRSSWVMGQADRQSRPDADW
jgi:hypothetical protein